MQKEIGTGIDKLEVDLVDSIASENLSDIAAEAYDAAFDLILEEGLIKNLPIFGVVYKGGKALMSIRDQYFLKKVFKFLCEIKDISVEKRRAFIKELEEEETLQRAGEALVMLIDRLDNLEKPIIIGRLLKAKVEGHITLARFLRLSSIVEKAFMPDLRMLHKFSLGTNSLEEETGNSLENLGLVRLPIDGGSAILLEEYSPRDEFGDYLTQLGSDLLSFGLSDR